MNISKLVRGDHVYDPPIGAYCFISVISYRCKTGVASPAALGVRRFCEHINFKIRLSTKRQQAFKFALQTHVILQCQIY